MHTINMKLKAAAAHPPRSLSGSFPDQSHAAIGNVIVGGRFTLMHLSLIL